MHTFLYHWESVPQVGFILFPVQFNLWLYHIQFVICKVKLLDMVVSIDIYSFFFTLAWISGLGANKSVSFDAVSVVCGASVVRSSPDPVGISSLFSTRYCWSSSSHSAVTTCSHVSPCLMTILHAVMTSNTCTS